MCFHFEARFSFATFFLKSSYFLKKWLKLVKMAQKCSKLIWLVPIVLTVIQENFFLYHHIPTTMLYCTDCFIPPGVSFPPFIKLWKGEFFKGWILDVGDGIFPNRMREGEGAASLLHMSWGGRGGLFYFFSNFITDIHNAWNPNV